MANLKRSDFLKMGALATMAPVFNSSLAHALTGINNHVQGSSDLFEKLVKANDAQVKILIDSVREGNLEFSRRIAYDIAVLSAAYCCSSSGYYHDQVLIPKIDLLVQFLAKAQAEDGTVNVGNLESPPDTAFVMEILCSAAEILIKDNSQALEKINEDVKRIVLRAGDALSIGGVHTPNHRWVISAALSQINSLYADKKYVNRINDWLGEGIYIDEDGHFPERSGTYSAVETTAFITMARKLKKPSLLDPVRKNLAMMYYYMELNGDFVSNDSRRQDQYAARRITLFYHQYRYMAILDKNPHFAAIAQMIESVSGFDKDVLNRSLFYFLENETLQQPLPEAEPLPVNYEKLFATSHLLRIKRDKTTISLFGGADWPIIIASGRSNSPDFFSYRKGEAILKYMRLSSGFFSMGYFYSEGLKKDGRKYILHKKLEVPYYQPLPKDKRNKNGDYELSPSIDDRFWNKMDFKNRPVSNVKTLDTTVTFLETMGKVELDFKIDGFEGVPVTIELCFAEGGELQGVAAAGNNNHFLETGNGEYKFKNDSIKFGPGSMAHKSIDSLEGERYITHFGSLRTAGMHVYLTGITPFRHKLEFN